MIYQGKKRHPVREIIVHCSATVPEWMSDSGLQPKIAEIKRWHMNRKPPFVREGYHWFIDRPGEIAPGRPETMIGAHVKGHNSGTIGICLIGGHGSASTDRFEDNFTAEQDKALRRLIAGIQGRTEIERISGHNEYAAKACPGFNVAEWLASARLPEPVPAPLPDPSPYPIFDRIAGWLD